MVSAALLVRSTRRAAGLTQAELARLAETTQPAIARLEREGANPRLDTLKKVIAATGHSLELALGPSPGIDETMIAANLRLTPAERLQTFSAAYNSIRELAPTRRDRHGSKRQPAG